MSGSHQKPVTVPRDMRWDCRSCAACCSFFELGPVDPALIDELKALKIEERWPPAAEGPWYEERTGPDGAPMFALSHRDGHCVFLRDDKLCSLHAMFGTEKKPAFCREYPWHRVEDPRGTLAYVRTDCGGVHESFLDGTPLEAQAAGAMAVPQTGPVHEFVPNTVHALPDVQVILTDWLDFEPILQDVLSQPTETPEVLIARAREALHERFGGVRHEPSAQRFHLAALAVFEGLKQALSGVYQAEPKTDIGRFRIGVARKQADAIGIARQLLEAGTVAVPDENGSRYLNLVIRVGIANRSFQNVGGVAEGLGRLLVETLLARALVPRDEPASADRLGPALSDWQRFSYHSAIIHFFTLAKPALVDLFRHAGAEEA